MWLGFHVFHFLHPIKPDWWACRVWQSLSNENRRDMQNIFGLSFSLLPTWLTIGQWNTWLETTDWLKTHVWQPTYDAERKNRGVPLLFNGYKLSCGIVLQRIDRPGKWMMTSPLQSLSQMWRDLKVLFFLSLRFFSAFGYLRATTKSTYWWDRIAWRDKDEQLLIDDSR